MLELHLGPRPIIPDRYLLVDADPIAYYAAFNMDEAPVEATHRRVDERISTIFNQCQVRVGDTGKSSLWLTGEANFRNNICTLKQYKGDRYDADGKRIKVQPRWIKAAKDYLVTNYNARTSMGCEADDMLGIAMKQVMTSKKSYGVTHVVISTVDKDLRINYCMHHNQTHGVIDSVYPPGELHLDSKGKPRGSGELFFYYQMLCGDTTDWIPGLPVVSKDTAIRLYKHGVSVRPGKCGPITAFNILSGAKTAKQAEELVWGCYKDYWMHNDYCHWKTGERYKRGIETARQQFIEQGQLLWMQQEVGERWKPRYVEMV